MGNFNDGDMHKWAREEARKKGKKGIALAVEASKLKKEYYTTVYKQKTDALLKKAMETNPNLMLQGNTLVNQVTGQKYPIDDPSKTKSGKSQEDQFVAMRNLKSIENAAQGKDWERRPKEIQAKAKHGKGGGFFDKASKSISNVTAAVGKAGEDIGRGVAKGATTAYKTLGDTGSGIVSSVGKGVEGYVANQNDALAAMLKGDFKGMAGESLASLQSVKDMAKGLAKAQGTLSTGALKSVGDTTGSKEISQTATNIKREGEKGVDKYGDAAIDMGISAIPGVGQAYALGKTALSGLAQGGIGAFTDPKLLAQLGTAAAASYGGVDPTLLSGASALAQGKGLKGAALQAAGSYAGLSADNAAMLGDVAGGDVKSALMNRAGAAAGLTGAQTGVGKALLGDGNLVSSLAAAGGEEAGLSAANQGLAGQVASGDLRGAALSKLAGQVSDPTLGGIIKSGSFDVKDIIANAGKTAAMGGALPGQTYMPGSVQDMIKQGQSAGRIVQSADAYAKDIQNQGLDALMGAAKNTQLGQAASAVIGKGETLASIAKKNGTTVAALMAANPNIKDANKIVAGAKLLLPKAPTRSPDSGVTDLSGPLGEGVGEENLDFNATQDLSGPLGEGVIASGEGVINPQTGKLEAAPSKWDKIKSGIGSAIGGISSAIKNNPNATNALLQGVAGVGGYMAGDKARDKQEALIEKQILETKGINELNKYKLGKDRDKAYADQQQFLGDRIAGGGFTAKERGMRAEGDLRSARAAAAGRMAGIEQQARMGQGVTGAGSGLAASLMGAQSGANMQAESERAAATSAEDNLEKAYGTRTSALENKAATEMNLAQNKDSLNLNKQKEIALQRIMQGNLELSKGKEQGNLISSIANTGSDLIYGNSTAAQTNQKYDNRMRQAELQKRENEANGMIVPEVTQNQNIPQQKRENEANGKIVPKVTQNQNIPQQNTAKGGALATLANPQGSTGVLAPAPKSTTPAMDAMNGFLTMSKLPSAGQAIANPQAAAKGLVDQKVAQAKQIATDLAKKKAAELQASVAAKAKSALPASVASAGSKFISNFKIPGLS